MMNTDFADFNDIDLTITAIDMVLSRDCPPTWKLFTSPRKQCAIVFVIDGAAEYSFDDRTERGAANDLVFFDIGDTYRTNVVSDNNYRFIVIAFSWTPGNSGFNLPFSTVNRLSHARRFLEQFKTIHKIWEEKDFGYIIHAKAMAQILVFELVKELSNRNRHSVSDMQIQEAKTYIDNNYNTPIRIEDLARHCGYSPSHFRKKFNELYGISPVSYINRIRVEKAKQMLKSSFYQNEEIAKLVGFSSSYYFCRVFKKLTGLTPKQY